MLDSDVDCGPGRGDREALRPLQNENARAGEEVFHAESFEVVEAFDAVEIAVNDRRWLAAFAVGVQQGKRGAGDILFAGSSEPADNALGERGFAAAEIAGKK